MALLRATLYYSIEFSISFTLFFFDLVRFMYLVLLMTQEKFEKLGKFYCYLARVPSMLDFVPITH